METSTQRIALKVEASVFGKHAGDPVRKGEVLGRFAGDEVKAPFDGKVEGVSFDPGDHALIVVVQQTL